MRNYILLIGLSSINCWSQQSQSITKKDSKLKNSGIAKSSILNVSKETDSNAYIDVLKTYERVTNKGYESEDMLKKMGNSYFFKEEYDKADKYYSKLFSLTTNLEPDYYYRYSIVLKSIGNSIKADEYLKKFNQLSDVNSR
mgnify:CR=1 FL=1